MRCTIASVQYNTQAICRSHHCNYLVVEFNPFPRYSIYSNSLTTLIYGIRVQKYPAITEIRFSAAKDTGGQKDQTGKDGTRTVLFTNRVFLCAEYYICNMNHLALQHVALKYSPFLFAENSHQDYTTPFFRNHFSYSMVSRGSTYESHATHLLYIVQITTRHSYNAHLRPLLVKGNIVPVHKIIKYVL